MLLIKSNIYLGFGTYIIVSVMNKVQYYTTYKESDSYVRSFSFINHKTYNNNVKRVFT